MKATIEEVFAHLDFLVEVKLKEKLAAGGWLDKLDKTHLSAASLAQTVAVETILDWLVVGGVSEAQFIDCLRAQGCTNATPQ